MAGTFGIQAIPTLMAFRDGILIFEQAGFLPGHALQKLIYEIKALDIAEVRAKVDDQAKTATAGTGWGCCGNPMRSSRIWTPTSTW